jgi:protein SCO1/2
MNKTKTAQVALLLAMGFAGLAAAARAESGPGAQTKGGATAPACCCTESPGAAVSKNSIYQLDARFQNDAGREFALGSLRGRPVVLDMFFTSCGYACPLAVTDMLAIQSRLPAELRSRTVFVLVSFDSVHDTPEVLAKYRAQRLLDGRWVLLHGSDSSVRELAALLGVNYRREADGSYTHSNVLSVLNRQGELAYRRVGLSGGVSELGGAVVAAGK